MKDWQVFPATKTFAEITHRVAGRLFMGREICRNDEFVRVTMAFADSLFANALIITNLPLGPLRGPLGWLVSQYHRWVQYKAVTVLEPHVTARLRADAVGQDGGSKHHDAIEWTIDFLNAASAPPPESRTLSLELLHNLQAGGKAPGVLLTEVVFSLLLEPSYLEPLRKEAEDAVRTYGMSDQALAEAPLLDSFIMETNRLYPIGSSKFRQR